MTALEKTPEVDGSIDFNETHVTHAEHIKVCVLKIYSVWLVCYTVKNNHFVYT